MKKLILLIVIFCVANLMAETKNSIPKSSGQLIVVITDSLTATQGNLYCFERNSNTKGWKQWDKTIDISLGRSGLGMGRGLHDTLRLSELPPKKEGDGRSPAGIFELSAVFGYESTEQMDNLNMPYIHVTEMIECIDDADSDFYNQIVSNQKPASKIDWNSSEKMSRAGIYYEQGIVVNHNTNPVSKGAGSCIFIHNWAKPFETTAGCTVMEPADLSKIIDWLKSDKNPVMVQLTRQLYNDLMKLWELPEIPK
ncbi:MAG: L,D-transpeptidase [Fidelibacterota bacterium]